MKYDQYGRPLMSHPAYGGTNGGYNQPPGTASHVAAKLDMPNLGQLGGHGQVPWVRFPFYPTSPFYSTNPNVGSQTRFYGATLLSNDADYVLGVEAIRIVQFDIPCRLIAVTGAATDTAAGAGGLNNLLNGFLFRMEYTTGDRLNTAARLASTCLGTMQQPGEIGGIGYNIDSGASWVLGITPLPNLPINTRIDITLICLEIRGPTNYNMVP